MQEIKDHCSITSSFMCYQDWLHKQETVLNPLTLAFRHLLLLPALFALALFSSLSFPLFLPLFYSHFFFSSLLFLFSILISSLSVFVPSLASFTAFITVQSSSI